MHFIRPHHQRICQALANFNTEYLQANQILFAGGTRIALELNEYRESVDIDFLCPTAKAYRAVRTEVSNMSLGNLVKQDFIYPREIRIDRDATRGFIQLENTVIKLEFVACADYPLSQDPQILFRVPMIDHASCIATKLLANADRYHNPPFKDLFDVLAMYQSWQTDFRQGLALSDEIYTKKTVIAGVQQALQALLAEPEKYQNIAVQQLQMNENFTRQLIENTAVNLLEQIPLL